MLHAPVEQFAHEPPPDSPWQPLRDLALCALLVCAIALVVGFLTPTSAHARGVSPLAPAIVSALRTPAPARP